MPSCFVFNFLCLLSLWIKWIFTIRFVFQVWVGTVSHGPQGSLLNGTFKQSETFVFQDDIGQLILEVCQTMPHGILCFFPSYSMMEKLTNRWQVGETIYFPLIDSYFWYFYTLSLQPWKLISIAFKVTRERINHAGCYFVRGIYWTIALGSK